MKLKTLKDLANDGSLINLNYRDEETLRHEAIKWIKHDLEYVKKHELNNVNYKNKPLSIILKEDRAFIRTWMKRFNITNQDIITDEDIPDTLKDGDLEGSTYAEEEIK